MNETLLKRRYGDRADWIRVSQREFKQGFFEEDGFRGYVTSLKVNKVTEPLFFQYEDKKVCIVNDGFTWLQHFPEGKRHSVTTMFNSQGEVVQWYIDICLRNGVENNRPYWDDLFLDIIIMPTGEIYYKDHDELEEALLTGVINEELYNIAITEAKQIKKLIESNEFELFQLTKNHKEYFDRKD